MTAVFQIEHLSKAFHGHMALDDVSLSLEQGQTCALVGQNGAGKSTLINIVSGLYAPDGGEIRVDGRTLGALSPKDAAHLGIRVVHQELSVAPNLSVAETLAVGESNFHGRLHGRAFHDRVREELRTKLGVSIEPSRLLRELSTAEVKLVQIAKALFNGRVRVLVLDEPTAPLSSDETRLLFHAIDTLKQGGTAIIYVSHYLDEVLGHSDRIVVLRNGRCVSSLENTAKVRSDQLAELMVGRTLTQLYPDRSFTQRSASPRLMIENLSDRRQPKPVSFTVHRGEILGISGIVGAGKEHLIDLIVGLSRPDTGKVEVDGHPIRRGSVRAAIAAGIAFIPRDRRSSGLIQDASLGLNLSLPRIAQLSTWNVVRKSRVSRFVQDVIQQLHIVPNDPDHPMRLLSGGNQQKAVIGRWIGSGASVLVLEDPTFGVDVGAKADIYKLIVELARNGVAILISSSDFAELAGLCDRVLVLRRSSIAAELSHDQITEQSLLAMASGSSQSPTPGQGGEA
ncbi:sugar ABC transporter ATP-binding protein [Bifidobacterium sp.]|uniref:sugar ABC transporter ATP-binding protein n=1 Tax=Bifidobacterium sp. TaxID=41200 RepID=UPI0039E9BD83